MISSTGKHFSAGMDLSVFTGETPGSANGGVSEEGRKRSPPVDDGAAPAGLVHRTGVGSDPRAGRDPGRMRSAVPSTWSAQPTCGTAQQDAFFCIQEINIGMTADVGHAAAAAEADPRGRRPGVGLHR